MPGVLPVYDINNKSANEAGDTERKARLALINERWAYYNNGFVNLPLKVRPGKLNDNVILNLTAQAVDQEVAFFAPKPPTFVVPGGMEREPGADGRLEVVLSPEQEAVNNFLKANEFDEQINDIGLSGFVTGHNFIRLYAPDNNDAISADNPPRMTLLDPRLVTAFWDISDIRRVLWYRLTWEMPSGDGKTVYRRQDIVPSWLLPTENTEAEEAESVDEAASEVTWFIIEYQSKTNLQWVEVGRDEWEYTFPPIVQWKNAYAPHEFYGRSDLRHTAISDAVNFIASNTARIIRYHAHPRTIIKGLDGQGLKETSVDGMWEIGESGEVFNLEMQSDLGSSLSYLDMLRKTFFTQMRVLDIASTKDTVGQLTNFGVQMLYKDMLDNISTKRSAYGSGLAEACRRVLEMMGFIGAPKPEDKWAEPLPTNKLEVVTALEKESALGLVSTQTMQEDLGRDPITEAERMDDEKARGADNTADVLDRITRAGGFEFGATNGANRNAPRLPMA